MNLSGKDASNFVVFSDEFDKEEQIGVASIDLRIDSDVLLLNSATRNLKHETKLVSSIERVVMPADVSAFLVLRSSMFRKGVGLASTGFVDPGFRGNLSFRLFFSSEDAYIELKRGTRVAQLVFMRVDGNTSEYAGKYQDSQGTVQYKPDGDK